MEVKNTCYIGSYIHPDFQRSEQSLSYVQNLKEKKLNKAGSKKKNKELPYKKHKENCHLQNSIISWKQALTLNTLWLNYITKLLDTKTQKLSHISSEIIEKLRCIFYRVDLHGAMISITKAKNSSLMKIKGVLLLESKNVFKILLKDGSVKVVPKVNTLLEISFGKYRISMYGEQLCHKPTDRFTKKIKKIVPPTTIE
uniref:Ribonuclease P protein subunit p29 n=1 Tax=Culicoides sonorensis TaxID=179676 RepID=A0A336M1X7_CULSO